MSGELQAQIGSKPKDKKKLVMDVWYEFFHDSPTHYQWSVRYRIRAEDKDLIGGGWHPVNKLALISYNFKYTQTGAAPVTATASINLSGQTDTSGLLIGGQAGNTAALPVFVIKHVKGERFGGPSGIAINW